MKALKVLLAFLAVFALWGIGKVPAADVMDRAAVCNLIATGAGARVQGFQGRTEWASKEQIKKYSEERYKGAMYIRDDGETPEERAKYEEPLMLGWKMEDSYMEKHAGEMKHPSDILDACMKQGDASAGSLYRASQNENLGDPSVDRIRKCNWLAAKLELAGAMKGGFDSADALLADIPFPEGWSDESKAWVREEITLLFGFTGGTAEFVRSRRMVCLHTST